MKTTFPTFDAELVAQIEEHLDMHYLTELRDTMVMEFTDGKLVVTFGRGRRRRDYSRPMFQLIPNAPGQIALLSGTPCARCGDFSRSWDCPEHQAAAVDPKPTDPFMTTTRRPQEPLPGIRSIDLSGLPPTVPDVLTRSYAEVYAEAYARVQRDLTAYSQPTTITITGEYFDGGTVSYELEVQDDPF